MKRFVAGVAALVWLAAEAMPSGAEIAKAKGIVDDLMAADLADARAGKKTHEEVGDAAMALAGEAEKPAEKYLLLTGAFDEYMKDDKFDDANAAIAALREALPDWSQRDELNLLDKALRSAGYGKGGPVRARYEALKERQQYGAKLKKAQAAAKKSPQNRKLQFQVGAYEAALGNWPAAVEAFAKGSNEAIRKAAELEKALENGAEKQLWKVADAWWEAGDVKPPFLAEAISAHAAALYGKALKDDKFTGLKRVAAERRVEEWEERSGARSQGSGVRDRESGVGVCAAKEYEQKGLVAHWDGIENAGYGTHKDGAKEWTDLKSRRPIVLRPGAKFSENALVCDGKGYSGQFKVGVPLPKIATADVVFEIVAAKGNSCIFSTGTSKGYYDRCLGISSGGSKIVFGDKVMGGVVKGKHSCHVNFDSGEYWLDGRKGMSGARATLDASPQRGNGFYVGGFLDSGIDCRIHAIRFYDRELGDEEIKRNHSLDKARFRL